MRKHEGSWFRLFAFCFTTTVLAAAACAGSGQTVDNVVQAGDYTGMISDSMCGARHVKHPNLDSANCTRECVRSGAKYKLIDGEKSYFLQGDFAELAQFAGQRAKVSGSLSGETIRISSINPI